MWVTLARATFKSEEHGTLMVTNDTVLCQSKTSKTTQILDLHEGCGGKVPQVPAGTHFASNGLHPAAFQPASISWGIRASNHSLNVKLVLGHSEGKLERSAERYSDEHHLDKTGPSAFPVGLCRWQINEDDLRGLSLMRLWR